MRLRCPAWQIGAAVLLLAGTAGCGRRADKWEQRRPPTFPASGVVLMDGKPVENAVVAFDSREHNLTAVGRTDRAGRFTLKTFHPGDGAVAGDHRVRIEKWEVTGYAADGAPLGEINRLPGRYEGPNSPLAAAVSEQGGNTLRFELSGTTP